MRKTALLLVTLLTFSFLFGCGEAKPAVSWEIPSNDTIENNVNIEFDDESVVVIGGNRDTTAADTTAEPEPETVVPVDTEDPSVTEGPSGTEEPSDTEEPFDTEPFIDTDTRDTTEPPVTAPPVTTQQITAAPTVNTPPKNTVPATFSVKAKKYCFEGNNILLFDTKNLGEFNCNFGIVIKYYSEDGTVLKRETRIAEKYAAGESRYIVFNPGIVFENYSYAIVAEKCNDICYSQYLDISLVNFGILATPKCLNGTARTKVENSHSDSLYLFVTAVVFDEYGEIKYIDDCGGVLSGREESFKDFVVTPDLTSLPRDWADGCSIIYADTRVITAAEALANSAYGK